jgi:hypothetical protein
MSFIVMDVSPTKVTHWQSPISLNRFSVPKFNFGLSLLRDVLLIRSVARCKVSDGKARCMTHPAHV